MIGCARWKKVGRVVCRERAKERENASTEIGSLCFFVSRVRPRRAPPTHIPSPMSAAPAAALRAKAAVNYAE